MRYLNGVAAFALAALLSPSVARAEIVYPVTWDGVCDCPPTTAPPVVNPPVVNPPIVTPPVTPPPVVTPPVNFPSNARFTTPNFNYVQASHGTALAGGRFAIVVNQSLGDSVALNTGEGYVPTNANVSILSGQMLEGSTAQLIQFAPGGTITITEGTTILLQGQITGLTLEQSLVGYDYTMTFTATGGEMKNQFGSQGAAFGLIYNVDVVGNDVLTGGFTAQSKGDITRFATDNTPGPAVPEPATLALVAMGLGGIVARSRRRFA